MPGRGVQTVGATPHALLPITETGGFSWGLLRPPLFFCDRCHLVTHSQGGVGNTVTLSPSHRVTVTGCS